MLAYLQDSRRRLRPLSHICRQAKRTEGYGSLILIYAKSTGSFSKKEEDPVQNITESDFQQPHPDSRASADHKYINGEQEAIVWGETEVQINQSHMTDQLSLSSKAGQKIPEEAEEWEQIVWPVRPMTCTSTPLSCATVQWDMPGVSVETYSLMNDSSLANKLDSGGVTCRDSTSPSPHQSEDVNAELFVLEEREEHDGSNSQLLSSVIEWTGSSYEPCDAAAQEWMTHEKEDSTHQLLKKIPLRTDSEEEEGHWLTSDPVETVDLINTVEETEVSEDGVDSFVDLKLEEERGESVFLLTGQGNSEEEQTSVNGLGTEEETEKGDEVEEELSEKGDEVEEELSVTNVSCTQESDEETKTVCSLSDV
uniref:uncharacterized protein LOC109960651 isoform X2 n=1 Tax=Monopterus albus TaxID=43700 RepID=UPI0009B42ACB|nr:uncharacterized protein LOC109960651 isoform X2 [Monopterus albus]